ncbi:scarecrow-like protein 30 [Coffea arabica]|uniref:Scarecrow-like protein 30 n=1 Tax=Coffea arabica TaxID=13443 RepID=A0A6P6VL22_COFAR|nr:scarecrow-like protein 14 [Coffea arabica]
MQRNCLMEFKYNCQSISASLEKNLAFECGIGSTCNFDVAGHSPSVGSSFPVNAAAQPEGDSSLPVDHFDGVFKYLNQMLMEEDLEQRPCMYQDLLALQAAEKSFHDALTGADFNVVANKEEKKRDDFDNGSRRRRNHDREDSEHGEGRSSKLFASHNEAGMPENEAAEEMYDKALLCPKRNPGFYDDSSTCDSDDPTPESKGWNYQKVGIKPESKRGRPRAGEKKINIRELVDLSSLLTQSAQAVAEYDNKTAQELLNRIREHSSPCGDATGRLAHYFANALEARISGMGTTLYTSFTSRKVSAGDILKAYQAYILACPFKRMSNIFADKSIGRLTKGARCLHIIDFGIAYGFQWPCLIQGLSLRPGGPPKLHITGIDLPQPGFQPTERVEETGRRLAYYCKKFNVPFEYHAIAKRWETIQLEDLKIGKGETIVVNCLYRLRHIPDETAEGSTARDDVLNLIKKINPDFFVHGVTNGTYNVPFFVTRFREALHHFSSLFDMLEKTVPQSDQDRMLFEKEVLGRDSMNVIACEGSQRIERPETYKQWHVRNQRAGFSQLPLNQDIVREVRAKVKLQYHKDFLVDEDGHWILQGWKGRVFYALSCWKPIQD